MTFLNGYFTSTIFSIFQTLNLRRNLFFTTIKICIKNNKYLLNSLFDINERDPGICFKINKIYYFFSIVF